jgi:type II secretory pathway component PulL
MEFPHKLEVAIAQHNSQAKWFAILNAVVLSATVFAAAECAIPDAVSRWAASLGVCVLWFTVTVLLVGIDVRDWKAFLHG